MKENNPFNFFLINIASFFLLCILLFGSFSLIFNYKGAYYSEYEKNNVYENVVKLKNMNIAESREYVKNVTDNIFKFFKNKEDLKYFSEEEKSHMKDVKFVVSSIKFIYYISTILFITLFFIIYFLSNKNKILFMENLYKIIIYGSSASFILLIIIFLWAVFSFDTLFLFMHLILFPQGNWMFPEGSLLITLFPEQFFFDMALRMFVYAIFQSVIFFIIGYWLRKQVKLTKSIHKNNWINR